MAAEGTREGYRPGRADLCNVPGYLDRPVVLDLFCGDGGAAMGYYLAGFRPVGVDSEDKPHYPFEFHQADAMTYPLTGYDAYHGSPPCKGHTTLAAAAGFRGEHGTEWMLHATIERFASTGRPYVVENVEGADMPGALMLCGSEFDLHDGPYVLRRHRRFVSNVLIMGAGGCRHDRRPVIGVYGELSKNDRRCASPRRGRPHGDLRAGVERARRIMGMPWASPAGLSQAIPPAYTEHIGAQLLAYVVDGRRAA